MADSQTEHLQEVRVIEHVYDGAPLSKVEQYHLGACISCQRMLGALKQLQIDFNIARLSQVSSEAEARYFAAFAERNFAQGEDTQSRPANHALVNLRHWLTAMPLWDSRSQTFAAGVRSVHSASYRLLFGVDETEIELMVETQNGLRRVMGEVIFPEGSEQGGISFIQLNPAQGAIVSLETESDAVGRFELEHVPPGVYSLHITPLHSQIVAIDTLEIT